MNTLADSLSRRSVLSGGGALIVSFSLLQPLAAQERGPVQSRSTPPLPGSLNTSPMLDSWIRIDADGITVFTGKAELGQGIKTAAIQVAAEELSVEPRAINLVTADTSRTPNEGYTSGSQSMQDSATAIRHAAAQAREILINAAASRLATSADRLNVRNGVVTTGDGRSIRYGELVANELLHVHAQPQSKLKDPSTFAVIGQPMQRVDIPAKVTGGVAYVQDLRLPGMVHARVVRPPNYGARLRSVGTGQVENMPGVLKVVRDGSFLAVIAEKEYLALRAMDVLALTALWEMPPPKAITVGIPKSATLLAKSLGKVDDAMTTPSTWYCAMSQITSKGSNSVPKLKISGRNLLFWSSIVNLSIISIT